MLDAAAAASFKSEQQDRESKTQFLPKQFEANSLAVKTRKQQFSMRFFFFPQKTIVQYKKQKSRSGDEVRDKSLLFLCGFKR